MFFFSFETISLYVRTIVKFLRQWFKTCRSHKLWSGSAVKFRQPYVAVSIKSKVFPLFLLRCVETEKNGVIGVFLFILIRENADTLK